MSVADKAPSEAVFRGTEFLSYDLSQTGGEPIVSAQDTITLYFKTRQPNGLLFYTGSIRTLCHTQPQQCPSQPCLNGGTCTEGWNRFVCDCTNTTFTGPTCGKEAATLSFNGSAHMTVRMDKEMVTQTEDIILRFRTSKPLGLLLISSTVETGDRIELAVAAGRIRLALRVDVKEKRKEDREKDT
ncbi:hypothetical protein HUJ04_004560, partial [Dendroctonus ponderosae]